VFGAPTGDYMTLICFKNGALARGRVRDQYGLDWKGFDAALAATPPGGQGGLMLPWFEPEIVPRVAMPGVRRRNLDEGDAAANVRALVEGQMMALRLHAQWMGTPPQVIHATGGGAESVPTLQVMADVHGCPVDRSEVGKSAALQAAHAWAADRGQSVAWPELVRGFTDPVAGSRVTPRPEAVAAYDRLLMAYEAFEQEQLS
jgi:xylulokinase